MPYYPLIAAEIGKKMKTIGIKSLTEYLIVYIETSFHQNTSDFSSLLSQINDIQNKQYNYKLLIHILRMIQDCGHIIIDRAQMGQRCCRGSVRTRCQGGDVPRAGRPSDAYRPGWRGSLCAPRARRQR